MRRVRAASLAVVTALAAGCAASSAVPAALGRAPARPPAVVATFTGVADPSAGTLSIQLGPAPDPGALTVAPPFYDGTAGTGPVNTFEIATDPAVVPSTVPLDCDGGTVNAWEGDVIVRSFFRNQAMRNVYAEVTGLSPTGHEACNSVSTPVAGLATNLNGTYGLWSYGDLVPAGTGTGSVASKQRWKFRFSSSETFTFQGRIWATLGEPTAVSGGPELDWAATSLVDPPRTFQEVGTTVSHIVWDGTSFVDPVGNVTFAKVGGTGGSVSTNLADPTQPYATFGDGAYYVETTSSGAASALDLGHGFTVCAKLKPGVLPQPGIKTLFAKGDPVLASGVSSPLGFALTEMNGEYGFNYRSPDDNAGSGVASEIVSLIAPGTSPESWTYDYVCGGRADPSGPTDGYLWVGAHGAGEVADVQNETGFFDGTTLPLVIAAVAGGYGRAADAGLYEVIIDSRGATPDVIREIVGMAEGRFLPSTFDASQRYEPRTSSATPVTGADGASYTLPPYATIPVSTDGTGLLTPGTVLRYTHPLQEHTATTGFCVGASVQATGPWSSVMGTLLQYDNTAMNVLLNEGRGFHWYNDNIYVFDGWTTEGAWADGSEHVFKACIGPQGPGNTAALYLDASTTPVASQTPTSIVLTDPDMADTTSRLTIGGKSDTTDPLVGGRLRRLFICPDPNPANCR